MLHPDCSIDFSPYLPVFLNRSYSGSPVPPSPPAFRPSVAQRHMKTRPCTQADALADGAIGVQAQHSLLSSTMSSFSGDERPPSARSSPLGRISAMFQATPAADSDDDDSNALFPAPTPARQSPLGHISSKFQANDAPHPHPYQHQSLQHQPPHPAARASPLSRISAAFQVPGAQEEESDDALFPSRSTSAVQQTAYGVIADAQAHCAPSGRVSSSGGRVSSSGGGRQPSAGVRHGSESMLSRTSISGPSAFPPGQW